jgi:hypothetical protein
MKKFNVDARAALLGTSFAVSLAASPLASAAGNPFGMQELPGGFTVAAAEENRQCGTFCGGAHPTFTDKGEIVKCGNVCGEVAKCGNICGGFGAENPTAPGVAMKDGEVAKCGNICASAK